ncbi:hypothetical protein [Hymenobacter terrenus]|uniref:hypothetical protein n=1 Tax=Hymenobacter terrenus TaxID=1629124 RepID=UPI0006195ECA|nr:hypothetical protein [Hymenobacter terrenus]
MNIFSRTSLFLKTGITFALALFFSPLAKAQDVDVNDNLWLTGSNGWLFHTPNDTRTDLYIVPSPNKVTNWPLVFTFKSNGSFGIGTNPTAKLHVVGLGGVNIDFLATGRWKTTANDGGLWIGEDKFIGSSTAAPAGPIGIYNGGKYRLMVKEDGRVVIGDDVRTPVAATGYALSVRGKVFSEEVKVALASAWPDYVFAPTYQLRPLAEVGQFIAQNRHLPGLPSAQQVSTDGGVELGKMNAQLLEKVEELTLYLLEQQKQVETLKKQVAELQAH